MFLRRNKQIKKVATIVLIGTMGLSSLSFASEGMKMDANAPMMASAIENRIKLETEIDTLIMQKNTMTTTLTELEAKHHVAKEAGDLTTLAALEETMKQLKAEMSLNDAAVHTSMKSLKKAVHKGFSSEQLMNNMKLKKELAKMDPTMKILSMESISAAGHDFKFMAPPVMKDEHILVPIKTMAEAFGATVVWNSVDKTVTLTKDSKIIVFNVGSKEVTVDGVKAELVMPTTSMKGNMYIPLNFIAKEFGMDIDWHADIEFAKLSHTKKAMLTNDQAATVAPVTAPDATGTTAPAHVH